MKMNNHIMVIAGQDIKVKTVECNPPIPIRSFDWRAYEDGYEEDYIYGSGATEEEALSDLAWQLEEKYGA